MVELSSDCLQKKNIERKKRTKLLSSASVLQIVQNQSKSNCHNSVGTYNPWGHPALIIKAAEYKHMLYRMLYVFMPISIKLSIKENKARIRSLLLCKIKTRKNMGVFLRAPTLKRVCRTTTTSFWHKQLWGTEAKVFQHENELSLTVQNHHGKASPATSNALVPLKVKKRAGIHRLSQGKQRRLQKVAITIQRVCP